MAGGGLDDELLALAGDSDNEHKSSRKQASRAETSSDDERLKAGSSSRKRPSSSANKASSSVSKKIRVDLLNESGDDSDRDAPGSDADAPGSDDDDVNGGAIYNYQGVYKNAEDMEQLLAMNELEREDILARRKDEMNKRRQKIELAALVKAQQAAAGVTQKKAGRSGAKKSLRRGDPSSKKPRKKRSGASDPDDLSDISSEPDEDEQEKDVDSDFEYSGAASAAKNRKKKVPGQTDTKLAKLSELRNRRKEKAAGVSSRTRADSGDEDYKKKSQRGYGSSSSDEDEGMSYSDSDAEIYGKSKSRKSKVSDDHAPSSSSKEPPTLEELNAARVSRDTIEQRLYAPRWKEALTDAFIRFSWGRRDREDGQGKEEVYRIHQITDVVEKPGKFYDLSADASGKWTNVYLVFDHNNSEYEAKLSLLSRSDFTESERERWIRTLSAAGHKIPRASHVIQKADVLEKFFTSPLTENDIGKMLEHKKRLKREAISVMGGRAVASTPQVPGGVATPIAGYDSPIPGLNGGSQLAPASLEAKLASMNERNRAAAKSKISDVERRSRAAAKVQSALPSSQLSVDAVSNSNGSIRSTEENQLASSTNGFVKVNNLASSVEIDLGDF